MIRFWGRAFSVDLRLMRSKPIEGRLPRMRRVRVRQAWRYLDSSTLPVDRTAARGPAAMGAWAARFGTLGPA